MKRGFVIAIMAMLFAVLSFGLIVNDALARDKEFVKVAGGSSGGTLFMTAAAICKVITAKIPWIDATPDAGGSVMNTRRVGTNKVKLGLVTSDTATHAITGGPEFKAGELYPDIRAMFTGSNHQWHMVTLEKSGIKTMQDLKGKKVCIGYAGGAVEIVSREVLKEYNLLPDKDFKSYLLTQGETVTALRDKTIDAGAILTGAPSGPLLDLAATENVRFIPINPDMQDKIAKKFPYYIKEFLTNKHYTWLKEAVPILSLTTYMITHKDTSDEMVYAVTKAMAENTKMLTEVHPSGADWTIERVKMGFPITVHPGALQYFNERGIKF